MWKHKKNPTTRFQQYLSIAWFTFSSAYSDHLLSSAGGEINSRIEGPKSKTQTFASLLSQKQSLWWQRSSMFAKKGRDDRRNERERKWAREMQAPGRKKDSRGELLFCWEQLHLMYLVIKTSVSHGVGGGGNGSQAKCIMQKEGADQSCGEMACLERMNAFTLCFWAWPCFEALLAGKNKMEKQHLPRDSDKKQQFQESPLRKIIFCSPKSH